MATRCLPPHSSLIKERKADVEREQALKFVRAFLEVTDGVREVSRGVVRTIAAIAEHSEDRLKAICIETLAEIMIRDPQLLLAAGGLRSLTDALREGAYDASEGLTSAFLYLLDTPQRRKYLRSGYELEILFTPFTDPFYTREHILKQNARAISSAMKSWPGLLTLSMYNFRAVKSLISSLMLPHERIRDAILDLVFELLRIKPPSWSVSYLAGRRLTTYGRVANLKSTSSTKGTSNITDDEAADTTLVDHYIALTLAVLISAGMLPALLQVTKDSDKLMKRKSTLLIGEVLKLANKLLPSSWSCNLQLLPELFAAASHFGDEERYDATGTVYQIDSVSRILYRSAPSTNNALAKSTVNGSTDNLARFDETPKNNPTLSFDEATFRQMLLDTQVLTSGNYLKWNWDIILKIIEGPLLNGKRLDEAIKASKFIKRIMSFYRPFKYKFAEARNTRLNQKYVKVGCALMHTLLQTAEGVRYLADNKLLRQIAECLAQCDPVSEGFLSAQQT
jgi:rapamycin-insensitive companion of mTOR